MAKQSHTLLDTLKGIKVGFTVASIAYLVLGLVLIFAPNQSSRALCSVISIVFTAYGLFNVLSFFLERGVSAYSFELVTGIIAAAFGIFSLISPNFLMHFLFIALGLAIMVGSICGIKRALNLRAFGFERWWLAMISACATLVLALTFVFFPGLYGALLMMAVGLVLVVESVSDLLCIHRLAKLAKEVDITYSPML